jgi:hypothetical protein
VPGEEDATTGEIIFGLDLINFAPDLNAFSAFSVCLLLLTTSGKVQGIFHHSHTLTNAFHKKFRDRRRSFHGEKLLKYCQQITVY